MLAQRLQEIRDDDTALGDDLRFSAEVYTHRRELLQLIDDMLAAAQPTVEEPLPIVVCKGCFIVFGANCSNCPHCGEAK